NATSLNSGKLWLGDGSNKAQEQTMSGDASISNTGTITIAASAVTTSKINDQAVSFAKMQNISTTKIIGRSTAGSGSPEELSIGGGLSIAGGTLSVTSTPASVSNSSTLNNGKLWLGDGSNLAQEQTMSGDASLSNLGMITIAANAITSAKILDSAVTTAKINNQAVTYAKLQNVSASARLLGRATAGAGSAEELSVGSGLTLSGTTLAVTNPSVTGSALNSALIWIGDGSNTAQPVSLSGDASVSNAGILSIASSAITTGKISDSAVTTLKVADDAISFAKIQNINPLKILGRSTAGVGDAEELSIGGGLSIAGGILSITSTPASVTNSSTLNNGKLWLGDGSNLAQEQTMSGDASITSGGSITIAANAITSAKIIDSAVTTAKLNNQAVTYAKLQNVSASARLIGRATAGAGSAEELTVGSGLTLSGTTLAVTNPTVTGSSLNSANFWLGDGSNLAQSVSMSGDATMANTGIMSIASSAVTTGKINDQAVTYGKIQNVSATNRILGRSTAGAGSIEELTLGSGLSLVAGVLSSTVNPSVSNTAALNSANIWVGDGSNIAQERTITGDATISNAGIITVVNSGISSAKIADQAVTLGKIANISTNTLLGRTTAGAGSPEELTIGAGLSVVGGVISAPAGAATVTSVSGTAPITVA
ncbi:MAG: hypothetical protein V4736_06770, partial [Bdellovibrionota bacterium]